MDILFLLIGLVAGALACWYILGLRFRQSHAPRTELDALTAKLNQTTADLRFETERAADLGSRLAASDAIRAEKENALLAQTGRSASLESELAGAKAANRELQAELDKTRAALDAHRENIQQLQKDAATTTAQLDAARTSLQASEQAIERLTTSLQAQTEDATSLKAQVAELTARKQAVEQRLETQKAEIEAIRKQSEAEFHNLANRILEEKAERFTALNKTNLESILKPLGDNIEGFRKKVDEVYEKEAQQRFSLGEKVAELVALNRQISVDATNLTRALEGSAKTQGDWGEMILERILEQSGLQKGREYFVQELLRDDDGTPLKNEDGSRMQPDVIVAYPDDRKVIIDSKVSLVAYKRFSAAESRGEQDAALKQHVDSIKRHIDGLSRRDYPDFAQSLDFVMMFVPVEPAYLVAMQHDPDLWNFAYARRVLLISPTNLIAALKLIADLWKREYQNRHAIEIAEKGGALYDKFVGFIDALASIGAHLDSAQTKYHTAMNMIKDGRGNIISRIEGLKKLGVRAKKSLPSNLVSQAALDDAEEEEEGQAESPGEERGTADTDE